MRSIELAERFLQKADQDMLALGKWRYDSDISKEILGFHAQQAAEKMLKALLASREIEFPFTHRLADLIDLARENCIIFPEEFEEVRFLTPFAVEFRYAFFEESEEPVDFEKIFALLTKLRKWVDGIIHS